MAVAGTHFDLKILVDKEKGKVLFAEADGDFVDVLFSFLTLPIGTIVRLIAKTQPEQAPTLGCFATLCHSVKNLGDEYFWDEAFKDMLLHPRSSSEVICRYLKVSIDDTEANCFLCPNHQNDYCIGYMSFYQNSWCPGCGKSMNVHRVIPLDDSSKGKVFVTKASKFIITDDLQVIPIVPGTVIDFLNNLGFNDMSAIEGRTAKLGMDEVIELLKWTLLSTTPLTDLFVSKNRLRVINPLPQTPTIIDRSVEDRKISVNMVLKKSNKEVLFVEAGTDFIDFLFSFLIIPLGEALHLMEGKSGLGCIDGLYKSVLSLDSQYFVSQDVKNILLRPTVPPLLSRNNPLFELETPHLTCYVDGNNTRTMPSNSKFFGSDGSGGFVREDETFIVFDNLALTPFSTESVISICDRNKLSLSGLEERSLSIGIAEGISILRAALNSTSAISNGLFHNSLIFKEPKQEK